MRFDLISDVHQDMGWRADWPSMGDSDVLVLPGDLHNTMQGAVNVLKRFADHYEKVLYVDGNHEYYGARGFVPVEENLKTVRDYIQTEKPSNVHYLSQEGPYVSDDGVAFVGANGWYNFMAPGAGRQEQIEDYRYCNNDCRIVFHGDPSEAVKAWYQDLTFLRGQLASVNSRSDVKTAVVVTHTLPTEKVIHPKYPARSNGGFLNGMADDGDMVSFLEKVSIWCFGHTHDPWNTVHNGIRFIANPRGYKGEGYDNSGLFHEAARINGVIPVETI